MKTTLHVTRIVIFFFVTFSMFAQDTTWEISKFRNGTNNVTLEHLDSKNYMVFQLNIENLKQQLLEAPHRNESQGQSNTIVQFPNVKGELETYRVVETAIFSSEYGANANSNIKTYLGSRADDSGTRVRFSVTPLGLKAMISEPGKEIFYIQPVTKVSNGQYLVYNRNAKVDSSETFECLTEDLEVLSRTETPSLHRDANDQLLRTFRIAISTTSQYTNFWNDGNAGNGGAQQDALAQMVSTLNRMNEIFEVDMAITFQLVDTVDDPAIDLVYSGTDPYGFDLNGDLQDNLTATVGESDYDIGHLLHFDDNNGNAGCIGCVCDSGKGSGFSSHLFEDNDGGPFMADFFDVDYVPHEVGHQMGAYHTHAAADNNSVNFEPGSGTTIMGYAGITGTNDVQDHSDPYFHYGSINQILNNIASAPNNCAVTTAISNSPPLADAGIDYTIPNGTAFVLKGSAIDSNGSDILTYCWEQIDDGYTTRNDFTPTLTNGPLWRSRPPNTSPDRYMPILDRVLNGQLTESNPLETVDNSSWETVSSVGRSLNFALTVRDRSEAGGVGQTPQSDFDFMTVTVDNASGPFVVTSQTTNESWDAGSMETITWNVAGTDGGNVNTPTVNILLSVDGGQTFPFTMASNVPNDGSHDVTVPVTGSGDTSTARVIVEGNNNIFYAVNASNFSILESEFVVTVDATELDVCQSGSLVYDFTYNTFLGFSDVTTFSALGLPAGASAVINPTSATADGTTGTITINGIGSLAVGSYPFTFQGISGSITKSVDLIMNVYSNSVDSAVLTLPNNGAVGLSTEAELVWTGSDNAQEYLVEISTNSNFTTLVDSETVQTTSYIANNLNTNTLYYWRVTASNLCNTAPVSSVFSFITANISCNSYLDDVQQNISAVGSGNTVVSTINVGSNLLVTDVNVTLNITHTYTADLEITLTSPLGTVVDLILDEGGSGDNLTNTTFDQEGTDGLITAASAPFTGSFLPEGDLSNIYGETSGGNWVLTIVDDANQDGGTFDSFELYLCLEGTLSVNDESSLSNFVIYPNPNKGTFNVVVNNSNSEDVKISVFDIRGRRIFDNVYESSPSFNQTVNLDNAQSGMYLVTVENGTQKITKRIIID